jgi:hypothetical protein
MLESGQFLAKATSSLVAHSLGNRERPYSVHDLSNETLYDLTVLRDASRKHLARNDLDQDQRKRVSVVLEAVEPMLALPPSNKPEVPFPTGDDREASNAKRM